MLVRLNPSHKMMEPANKPTQNLLVQENAALRLQVQTLRDEVEQLKQHNHVLRLKVDAMARRLFGRSSEKLDAAQMQMVFEALQNEVASDDAGNKPDACDSAEYGSEADVATTQASVAPSKPKKKRKLEDIIEGLSTTEIIIDPQEVKDDPEAWECIGAEVTKLIDIIPAQFECKKIIRRKYVRKEARYLPPITPPLNTLQDRCIATPRLLAYTLISRFEMHLPYYRIEQMYARLGVPIPRQTLCGWAGMAHDASRLIIEAIQKEVFADGYVMIDETPIKYRDPKREGACGTGYLWAIHNPIRNVTLFVWSTGRGLSWLDGIVPKDFHGYIQCDGYVVYDTFIKLLHRQGKIILVGCMAHARRKFFEAQAEGEDSQWIMGQVQQLYRIERELKENAAEPEAIKAERQQKSAPIMERIKTKLQALQASRKHLPKSLTGTAISYMLNQWDKLSNYLSDGRARIDNNPVENAIRPSAIGKKNWLFMGDPETGHRAATFYTLIANCQRQGINAEAYLTDIFKRLPAETNQTVQRLTPKNWAAERTAGAQALAQAAALA